MSLPVSSSALADALRACGVDLPSDCADVKLTAPVDGLMQVHFVVNVTGALAHKIGKALQLLAVRERLDK